MRIYKRISEWIWGILFFMRVSDYVEEPNICGYAVHIRSEYTMRIGTMNMCMCL